MSGGGALETSFEAWDAAWLAGEPVPLPQPAKPAGINHPQIHALKHAAEQLRAARHWSHVDPDVAAAHREAVDALAAELAHHTGNPENAGPGEDQPAGHPWEGGAGTLTVIGNLAAGVRLGRTSAGTAVANFTIASTPRAYDPQTGQWKDGETRFVRCTIWGEAAENAASLAKGTRVIATGKLTTRTYQAKDGRTRTTVELDVHEIGPSLRHATATVTPTRRGRSGGPARARQDPSSPQAPGTQTPEREGRR